jgi:hypothetical protein
METWKLIPGWPHYEASSQGQIRNAATGRVLRQQPNSVSGYLYVSPWNLGKRKTVLVHRLICSAFHGEPFDGAECCHANDNRKDNRANNLSWGTHSENCHGAAVRHRQKGERNPAAKLTAFQVFMIKTTPTKRFVCQHLAQALGVKVRLINDIRQGNTWGWL